MATLLSPIFFSCFLSLILGSKPKYKVACCGLGWYQNWYSDYRSGRGALKNSLLRLPKDTSALAELLLNFKPVRLIADSEFSAILGSWRSDVKTPQVKTTLQSYLAGLAICVLEDRQRSANPVLCSLLDATYIFLFCISMHVQAHTCMHDVGEGTCYSTHGGQRTTL